MVAMDREALLRGLREAEERMAVGWAGARGQRDAAAALREVLEKERSGPHESVEVTVRLHERHMRLVFMTLCRRYGLEPYREPRQRRTSFNLKAPATFLDKVFWPLFKTCEEMVRREVDKWVIDLIHEFNTSAGVDKLDAASLE